MFSWVPGLSQIKTWGLVALSGVSLFAIAAWQYAVAKNARDKLAGSEAARKTEQADAKITVEGLQNEKDAVNNAINASDDELI